MSINVVDEQGTCGLVSFAFSGAIGSHAPSRHRHEYMPRSGSISDSCINSILAFLV